MGMFATIAQTKRAAQSAAPRDVPQFATPEAYRETAQFFVQLRRYLGLTLDQAAAHLQTFPSVIHALETGAVADLPPWPSTRRIVWQYASMAGIDPAPALHCLELLFTGEPTMGDEPGLEREPDVSRLATLTAWLPRRLPAGRIAVVGLILTLAGLGSQTSALQAAMTNLPAPLANIVRSTHEAILLRTARSFEGMAWIDVADPRSRRADKLPMKRR